MGALSKQYSNSKNFMARVELNRKFGTNPYKWTLWLFDQIQFKRDAKILELGCGNAILWKSNLQKIPENAHILLSDFSQGMLDDARIILDDAAERFEYKLIDAQQIPYPNNSFDIIIANLMLYHIPDRKKAISEISRVLKSDGTLYATAFGLNYMKELSDLVSNYDKKINCSLEPFARAFGLENGEKQLKESFEDVELVKYKDGLEVTEAEPLVNYVLSFTNVIDLKSEDRIKDFSEYIENILNGEGKIQIEKESGMFIAKKPY
ncbi:class I SAM-dependent methyltransferase [Methanobacterium sp.]|uniref:class I SAM-dependent methyltransferase n=1 Tax=Methanobacterium sp. TaxID=2164 RepID=UPI003C75E66C